MSFWSDDTVESVNISRGLKVPKKGFTPEISESENGELVYVDPGVLKIRTPTGWQDVGGSTPTPISDLLVGVTSTSVSGVQIFQSLDPSSSGATANIKSLVAGTNITLTPVSGSIVVSSTSGANAQLTSTGSGKSLVSDGLGPTLVLKGLQAGQNVTFSESISGTLEISTEVVPGNPTANLSDSGPGQSLILQAAGPNLTLRKIGDTSTIVTSNNSSSVFANIRSSSVVGQVLVSSGTPGGQATWGSVNFAGTSGIIPFSRRGTGVAPLAGDQLLTVNENSAPVWANTPIKPSVRVAANVLVGNSSISTVSYSSSVGTLAPGTITATLVTSDVLTIDTVTIVSGDRVLIWREEDVSEPTVSLTVNPYVMMPGSQGMGAQVNGIYVVTISGSTATFSRSFDFSTPAAINPGTWLFVREGRNYGGKNFLIESLPSVFGDLPVKILNNEALVTNFEHDIFIYALPNTTLVRAVEKTRGRVITSSSFTDVMAIVGYGWIPSYCSGRCSLAINGRFIYDKTVSWGFDIPGQTPSNSAYSNLKIDFCASNFTPSLPALSFLRIGASRDLIVYSGVWNSNVTTYPSSVSRVVTGYSGFGVEHTGRNLEFVGCENVSVTHQQIRVASGMLFDSCTGVKVNGVMTEQSQGAVWFSGSGGDYHVENILGISTTNDLVRLTGSHTSARFVGICGEPTPGAAIVGGWAFSDQLSAYNGPTLISVLGNVSTSIANFQISNCRWNGFPSGSGIYLDGIVSDMKISSSTFNTLAKAAPAANPGASPAMLGAVVFSDAVGARNKIKGCHFNDCGICINAAPTATTKLELSNNTCSLPVTNFLGPNWDIPAVTARAMGSPDPRYIAETADMLDEVGIFRAGTTAFGPAEKNTLFVDVFQKKVAVNAKPGNSPLSPTDPEFSVNQITGPTTRKILESVSSSVAGLAADNISNVRSDGTEKISAEVVTSTGAPTIGFSYLLSGRPSESFVLSAIVSCVQISGLAGTPGDAAIFNFKLGGLSVTSGGVVTFTVPTKTVVFKDGAAAGWDCSSSLVGSTLNFTVTGETNKTIEWKISTTFKGINTRDV